LRGLAQAAVELPATIVSGFLADPPTLLLATSADTGLDAGALLKPVLTSLGGKGGGNARLAQGSVPRDTNATMALAAVASAIGDR
jgi:alanyl-tRNA synthetase